MNRLPVRLVLSHLLVAVLGALATYVVVRQLAPTLFDQSMRHGPGAGVNGVGMAPGGGPGVGLALRQQFADAVDQALLVGALIGAAAAAGAGALAAYRLTRPLERLRAAAGELATGRYAAALPTPGTRELADLARDLGSLGRALADTETRRVRLLGEVAHELRTPLTVIDGYVEGMIDGVLPTTEKELGLVGDEVRRIRRLADDLSALSRADEGRLTLMPCDADLGPVVTAATERLRAQVEDAGLQLSIDVPHQDSRALRVRVDPDRIAQVVTNLVGNAVRATSAGGAITVTCRRSGRQAVVEVADTGEGLVVADLERVFERFYRAPGRRSPGSETGSGIGLTIARAIARAHGGELTADSAGPGRGATFTLVLPLADA